MRREVKAQIVLVLLLTVLVGACSKKTPPVARPMPPPMTTNTGGGPPPAPPEPPRPIAEPIEVPPLPPEDTVGSRSLDDLNRDSPLRPLYFGLDSADVDAAGQQVLQANASVLKKYPTWQVTIEGHCDERGTAEYNLALSERRSRSIFDYLVSLGVDGARLRTVGYGKEIPLCTDANEECWARNGRGHFAVTGK